MDSLLIETIVHINQLEIIVNFEKHVHVDFLFFMQYYIFFLSYMAYVVLAWFSMSTILVTTLKSTPFIQITTMT